MLGLVLVTFVEFVLGRGMLVIAYTSYCNEVPLMEGTHLHAPYLTNVLFLVIIDYQDIDEVKMLKKNVNARVFLTQPATSAPYARGKYMVFLLVTML